MPHPVDRRDFRDECVAARLKIAIPEKLRDATHCAFLKSTLCVPEGTETVARFSARKIDQSSSPGDGENVCVHSSPVTLHLAHGVARVE